MNVQDLVNAQTLSQLLQSGKVVLLDFHAPWCGPCKTAMPAILKLAQELPEVEFVKINIDDADATISQSFDVRSLPLFVLVNNAQQVKRWEGYAGQATIADIRNSIMTVQFTK